MERQILVGCSTGLGRVTALAPPTMARAARMRPAGNAPFPTLGRRIPQIRRGAVRRACGRGAVEDARRQMGDDAALDARARQMQELALEGRYLSGSYLPH